MQESKVEALTIWSCILLCIHLDVCHHYYEPKWTASLKLPDQKHFDALMKAHKNVLQLIAIYVYFP